MGTSESTEANIQQKKTEVTRKILEIVKQLEIVIEQFKITKSEVVLIGSRAARFYISSFRSGKSLENADWDLIISAESFKKWLHERTDIATIKLVKTQQEKKCDCSVFRKCE